MSEFRRERLIRFSDCDPAAIVFYPQYFVMFNALVEDWFDEALSIGWRDLVVERRIGLPTAHLEVDFERPSEMGERVALTLAVERLGRRSITLALACLGGGGDRRIALRQVLVTTSLVTHRSVDVPDDVRAAIVRFQPSLERGQP
ncbi:MAG TPA: thioesterase family protein [Ideonella sp.]|nr:thioesterase family protein [Ideonella sp.]